MPNILIRDLPDHVLATIDANAATLGLSRNEYIRRRLAQDVPANAKVTVEDLRRSAALFADLDDPEVMKGAWG